jgi:hypothetical protein
VCRYLAIIVSDVMLFLSKLSRFMLGAMTFSKMIFSIMTLSLTTLSIKRLFATFGMKDTQPNNSAIMLNVMKLSVAFYLF